MLNRYKIRASEHTLRYKKSAACFNEALPLGNGRIGAMVYGGVSEEKISLNEDTLWSGYPKKKKEEDYMEIYRKAGALFDDGKISEAQKLLEDGFGDSLVQMYLPLADLRIKTEHLDATYYNRVLKLNTAVHSVNYVSDGKKYTRETFVSEPYQVMAVHFQCDTKGSIHFEAALEGRFPCKYEKAETKDAFFMGGTAPNCVAPYGTAYRSTDVQIFDGKGVSFSCAVAVKAMGGSVTYSEHSVKVENADEAVLYFGVRTNFKGYQQFPDGQEYKEKCFEDVKKACQTDYHMLKKESIRSHKSLYHRCGISLSDGSKNDVIKGRIPTDERLMRLSYGEEDHALYALLFNYGRYLTISGSRPGTQPMNLQGIWNDRILPPWNSNYTLNINTEMNYWPTLACGLPECYEPFIRIVEELAESGKDTAQLYYGVEDGWVCHHSSDLWRLTHPGTNRLPDNAQWGFWNMASGWLSVMLWNYYRYTLDHAYLQRIYPVIEGAARFYRTLLVECDGELILPLSTSPENNYIESGKKHAIDKSTAMTQEILLDLFLAVSQAQNILEIQNEYEKLIPKLKKPAVQSDGELCEWHKEHEVWDKHHRHVSHLYGLFPANQFDEERKQASKKVLESRGDGGTGWSLAWKINLWARLGDGEHALQLLKNQLKMIPANEDGHDNGGGSYPNLLCAHPPFQIDGNLGAANGMIEMLLQCDEEDNPILLPALPRNWVKGSVSNLRLPGNRSISFSWEDGKVIWSKVTERKNIHEKL